MQGFGFRVAGALFRFQGFGVRVSGAGFRFQGFGFRVSGAGFRFQGFGFRVSGVGSACTPPVVPRAPGFGFESMVQGLGSRVG